MNRCLLALAAFVVSIASSLAGPNPLPFPATLAGMKRAGIQNYEDRAPGLGFSVRYVLGDRWADVYLYDKGMKTLRHGDPAAAAAERDAAVDEIDGLVQRGNYRSARIESKGAATLRATTFATARATIVVKELPLDSFVYVTVWSGKFLKVRLSTPPRPDIAARADAFVAALAAAAR